MLKLLVATMLVVLLSAPVFAQPAQVLPSATSPESVGLSSERLARVRAVTGGHIETSEAGTRSFQPMNINFGLFPPVEESGRRKDRGERKRRITARALADLDAWLGARRAAE